MSIKPLAAPTGGPRKNNGNERKQRSKLRPPEPREPPPSSAPGSSGRRRRCPRVSPVPHLGRALIRAGRRGVPLPRPHPIPQRQLIDSQTSGGSRGGGRGAREHPSPAAQDVEHRALQRLRSSLSAPAPPLSGASSTARLHPEPLGSPNTGGTTWQQSLG